MHQMDDGEERASSDHLFFLGGNEKRAVGWFDGLSCGFWLVLLQC